MAAGASSTTSSTRVRPGDPDAAGLLAGVLLRRGAERRRDRARTGPPVGRRLARGRAVAAHLAQRGLRHLRGVVVERPRRVATEQEIFDIFYNEIFPAESTDSGSCRSAIPDRSASSTARSTSGRDDPARPAACRSAIVPSSGSCRTWARKQAGGNVTTDEFIALAEHVSHQQLDDLFDTRSLSTTRPELNAAAVQAQRSIPKGKAKDHVRDAVRPMLERFRSSGTRQATTGSISPRARPGLTSPGKPLRRVR